jgi:histidine triad (HIT) family protein
MSDCLFCKIRDGQIPAKIVAQNDHVLAFRDVSPQAPTHVLVIPKKHMVSLHDATREDLALLGEMQLMAQEVARQEKLTGGYRTVFNTGPDAGQSVFHIHLHVLGGRKLAWPPG